jgi:hypothetical protein
VRDHGHTVASSGVARTRLSTAQVRFPLLPRARVRNELEKALYLTEWLEREGNPDDEINKLLARAGKELEDEQRAAGSESAE